MEGKTYTLWTYNGSYEGNKVKKIPLEKAIEKIPNYFYDTMHLKQTSSWIRKEYTVEDIRKMVEGGKSIFPFTTMQSLDEVKRHLIVGLEVCFMSYRDYCLMKKDYYLSA